MILAKGQPPEDFLGVTLLWLRTPLDGPGGESLTWGAFLVFLALVTLSGAVTRWSR